MFELMGCLVIIVSGTILGFLKSNKYRYRIKELRELQLILNYVRNEIVIFRNLLPEIFLNIREISKSPVVKIFENTMQTLIKHPTKGLDFAWKEGVTNSKKILSLSKEDVEIIYKFGLMLEKTDIKGQIANIDYLVKRLENQEKNAIEMDQKDGKLIRFAGVLAGVVISVVLY